MMQQPVQLVQPVEPVILDPRPDRITLATNVDVVTYRITLNGKAINKANIVNKTFRTIFQYLLYNANIIDGVFNITFKQEEENLLVTMYVPRDDRKFPKKMCYYKGELVLIEFVFFRKYKKNNPPIHIISSPDAVSKELNLLNKCLEDTIKMYETMMKPIITPEEYTQYVKELNEHRNEINEVLIGNHIYNFASISDLVYRISHRLSFLQAYDVIIQELELFKKK
jgi:hypothetical protein